MADSTPTATDAVTPTLYHSDEQVQLWHGDSLAVLREMPDQSVDCCVTSPPYFGLRDYGVEGQYGLEASPAEYVETMRGLFAEVRRVLADDGTLWLNIGDSYVSRSDGFNRGGNAPGKLQPLQRVRVPSEVPKNLRGMPWRTALALQDDGWVLRSDIIWHKVRADGRPVPDRPKMAHEHVFLFAKQRFYWFESASAEGNDVWDIAPGSPPGIEHVAPMALTLAERAILAGCKPGGTVLDPFSGSGTTGLAATKHGRKYVGIDLSSDYLDLSLRTRFGQPGLDLTGGVA